VGPDADREVGSSALSRDWTEAELALIERTPSRWARKRKLSDDAIKEIRRRVDSLSFPWTLNELAEQYGVTPAQISNIARRKDWPERVWEPDGQRFWREREIEEMLGDE
jgi:hypothetical protein